MITHLTLQGKYRLPLGGSREILTSIQYHRVPVHHSPEGSACHKPMTTGMLTISG